MTERVKELSEEDTNDVDIRVGLGNLHLLRWGVPSFYLVPSNVELIIAYLKSEGLVRKVETAGIDLAKDMIDVIAEYGEVLKDNGYVKAEEL